MISLEFELVSPQGPLARHRPVDGNCASTSTANPRRWPPCVRPCWAARVLAFVQVRPQAPWQEAPLVHAQAGSASATTRH